MIRVVLPLHLRRLAGVEGEVLLELGAQPTQGALLDALEQRHPALRGTIRDHLTLRRRPFLRYFACEQDCSHHGPETPLPDAVAGGAAPFLIVGAMSGG